MQSEGIHAECTHRIQDPTQKSPLSLKPMGETSKRHRISKSLELDRADLSVCVHAHRERHMCTHHASNTHTSAHTGHALNWQTISHTNLIHVILPSGVRGRRGRLSEATVEAPSLRTACVMMMIRRSDILYRYYESDDDKCSDCEDHQMMRVDLINFDTQCSN